MKVLVYTTQVLYPGGYENLALELASDLLRQDVDVTLLCHYPSDMRAAGAPAATRAMPRGLDVRYLDVPVSPSMRELRSAYLQLAALVRDLNVGMVDASGFAPAFLASVAARRLGVPVLIGVHHVAPPPRRGGREWWAHQALARFCRHVHYYGVSEKASLAWRATLLLSGRRVSTVPNCVGSEYFAPPPCHPERIRHELGLAAGQRLVLLVGRIMEDKGQHVAIDAIGPLFAQSDLHLAIVGRPESQTAESRDYQLRLEERIRHWGVRDRVHFLGLRNDVRTIMAAADVLVHVPRTEAFGLVVAEALAAGTPVIASEVGGIPEVLRGTGYPLVPPEDSQSLRSALIDLLAWPAEHRRLCINRAMECAQDLRPEIRTRRLLDLGSYVQRRART